MTVFADENQRLNEKTNSTISQICRALSLSGGNVYHLTKNYRNTRPIAELASFFYTGLKTGIPELPEADGDIPRLLECNSQEAAIEAIMRYAASHDNEEIGIIVQNNKMRKKYFNALEERLKNFESISVQTYSYDHMKYNDPECLCFDDGGIISVFNKQSCKGLEFDAVFLPELQQIDMSPDSIDQFRMEMYVMISRARKRVFLMYTNTGEDEPKILNYLPEYQSKLMEWKNEP